MKFLMLVMSLVCAAAAPTTQSDKPYKDLKSMIEALPKQVKPDKGDSWTQANCDLANEWFEKNIVGKKAVLVAPLNHADASGDGLVILTPEDFRADGLNCISRVEVSLADGEKIKLAKMKPKDVITANGSIKAMRMEMYHGTGKKDVASVHLELSDAVIDRKK